MDELDALISARNAAWWAVAVSALAALATFTAVAAAFIVQRRQANSDRLLQKAARLEVISAAWKTAQRGCSLLIDIDDNYLKIDPAAKEIAAERHAEAVAYFLSRDLTDPDVVLSLVALKSLLNHTVEDLGRWRRFQHGLDGAMTPEDLRPAAIERAIAARGLLTVLKKNAADHGVTSAAEKSAPSNRDGAPVA